MRIKQTLQDYDDYVDLCTHLKVRPYELFADNFYTH